MVSVLVCACVSMHMVWQKGETHGGKEFPRQQTKFLGRDVLLTSCCTALWQRVLSTTNPLRWDLAVGLGSGYWERIWGSSMKRRLQAISPGCCTGAFSCRALLMGSELRVASGCWAQVMLTTGTAAGAAAKSNGRRTGEEAGCSNGVLQNKLQEPYALLKILLQLCFTCPPWASSLPFPFVWRESPQEGSFLCVPKRSNPS